MVDLSQYFKTDEQLDEQYGAEEKTGFESIETGWYEVLCTKTEAKDSVNGKKLVMECKIIGPTNVNRLVWPDLWLSHTNQKAEGIGQRFLSKIIQANNGVTELEGAKFELKIVKKEVKEEELDNVFVSDSGKHYLYGKSVDENNYYNDFNNARPIKGESAPDFVKEDDKKGPEKKSTKKSSSTPPWVTE